MSDPAKRTGLAIIVSSPSGGGKTSLCQRLLHWDANIKYSITCTTRAPRPGEEHGKHYFFLTKDEFERRIAGHEFLEYAQYNGNYYGTPRRYVEEQIAAGHDVLMAIEVQGATKVMQLIRGGQFAYPDSLVTIFLVPPTLELLEQRLRRRGQDDEATIQKRLRIAEQELAHWKVYDYAIVTGPLDDDVALAKSIILAEKCRITRVPKGGQPWVQRELLS
jgi:guanylate kinase